MICSAAASGYSDYPQHAEVGPRLGLSRNAVFAMYLTDCEWSVGYGNGRVAMQGGRERKGLHIAYLSSTPFTVPGNRSARAREPRYSCR